MWYCKNCGAENHDESHRCGLCLTQRSALEFPCGSSAKPESPDLSYASAGARFCKYCGKLLYTASGGPSPAYCPHCGKSVGDNHIKPLGYRHHSGSSKKAILTVVAMALMIVLVAVLVDGERKPSNTQVKSTIAQALNSGDNPLAGPSDAEIRSIIDGVFEDVRMSTSAASTVNTWTTSILSHSWTAGDASDLVRVHIVAQYNTYQKIIDGSVFMHWNSSDEIWRADNSLLYSSLTIDTVQYDFSQLDGVWQGVYTHGTTYIADNLPYQVTLSNCGTITNTGDSFTEANVHVEHEFNDIWVDYSDVYYTTDDLTISVRYESRLWFAPSFVIEIPVEGFEMSTKATLRIDPEELVFEDPMAEDQVLVKAS